jgi:hypothetical protein
MVPYGEDSPDLFATKDEAADRYSTKYVSLGVQMTLLVQKELATFGERELEVVGVFEFDAACWPSPEGVPSKFKCFPPRPMTIRDVEMGLAQSQ